MAWGTGLASASTGTTRAPVASKAMCSSSGLRVDRLTNLLAVELSLCTLPNGELTMSPPRSGTKFVASSWLTSTYESQTGSSWRRSPHLSPRVSCLRSADQSPTDRRRQCFPRLLLSPSWRDSNHDVQDAINSRNPLQANLSKSSAVLENASMAIRRKAWSANDIGRNPQATTLIPSRHTCRSNSLHLRKSTRGCNYGKLHGSCSLARVAFLHGHPQNVLQRCNSPSPMRISATI